MQVVKASVKTSFFFADSSVDTFVAALRRKIRDFSVTLHDIPYCLKRITLRGKIVQKFLWREGVNVLRILELYSKNAYSLNPFVRGLTSIFYRNIRKK